MRIERGDGWELRLADWRDDIGGLPLPVDAVIEDPPYGKRTHAGQAALPQDEMKQWVRKDGRVARSAPHRLAVTGDLGYDHLTPADVEVMCAHADAICRGWTVSMTSHDLVPAYEHALGYQCGRYVFAPLPIVIPGMNVRLQGDGPSNWTVQLVVSRKRNTKRCLGTKRGAYIGFTGSDRRVNPVKGSKPLALMEAIVCDYSNPGDLVLDRYAGSGTTGVAALRQGRRFIGYERKPEHFEIALRRLQGRPAAVRGQEELFG